MDLLDYKIGCSLRLDIYDDNGKLIENEFVSRFERAVDSYNAFIATPIVEGVVYAVRVGWNITVYMQDGNSFYRFFARVAQRMQQDNIQILRILRVSGIDVAQRRQYYRFKCSVPFGYRIVSSCDSVPDEPFVRCRTADISGSGLSFSSEIELKKGCLMECELRIDDKPIYLIGKIVRCARKKYDETDMYLYEVGVLFSEIEEHNRELIIRFIFTEERRHLQASIA